MEKLNGLDLFSGIGGISVALSEWVNTVAYCEQDRYAQSVLLSRMADGSIDRAPIWDNIASLKGTMLPSIDIVFGGFPCQDLSIAGLGKGLDGERSSLFFEIIRLVKEVESTFVFLENVPAIRTRGLLQVVTAFTEVGYDCRWTCVTASSVGALHKRERWFLLAYAKCNRGRPVPTTEPLASNESKKLFRENRKARPNDFKKSGDLGKSHWEAEPSVGRVVDGFPNRVDRIKCLGNAVVPLQAKKAFKMLAGIYE